MKSKTPSISVVIPTYNNAGQIRECLGSLLAQEREIFEIIVVNDGSTDGTDKIVESFKNENSIIRLISTKNCGVSHARNLGVKKAKGDYVTFVDADDYLEKEAIGVLRKELKNNNNPDFLRYNFVEFGGKRFTNNLYGLDRGLLKVTDSISEINGHLLSSKEPIPNLCQLLVIKSNIAKTIQFDEGIIYLEDQLYYQELLKKSKNCLFSNYAGYMLRTTNSSSSMNPKRVVSNIESLLRVNRVLHELEVPEIDRVDDNHFRLMIGKAYLLSRDSNKHVISLIRLDEVREFAAKVADSDSLDVMIKRIAKCVSKRKDCQALFLIKIRGAMSVLARKVGRR